MPRRRSKARAKAERPWRANPTRLYTVKEAAAIHRKVGVLLSEGYGFAQAYAVAVRAVVPGKARGAGPVRRTVARAARYAR